MSKLNVGELLNRKNLITIIALLFMLSGIIAGAVFITPTLPGEAVLLELVCERYYIEDRIYYELKELDSAAAESELAVAEQELEDIRAEISGVIEQIYPQRSIGIALIVAGLSLGCLLIAIKNKSQLFIPLLALNLLVLFNIFYDISFFDIGTWVNHMGYTVLSGNFYNIIQKSTELVLLAMGMTFVIAATKGADISVGATAAISTAVFIKFTLSYEYTLPFMILAFLFTAFITVIVVSGFNGTLVTVFKIPTMVATLILFTTGRAIAYWINGGATPTIYGNDWVDYFGRFIPGVPIHTPVITVIICVTIIFLVLKFTNLRLYIQSVGINEKSARLCGINPVAVKYIAFAILGLCATIAAVTDIGRRGLISHVTVFPHSELEAILAVAIGGNSLSGGKFKLSGSIIGAYVIYGLNETLYWIGISSTALQSYQAIVIIFLLILTSPMVHKKATQARRALPVVWEKSLLLCSALWKTFRAKLEAVAKH